MTPATGTHRGSRRTRLAVTLLAAASLVSAAPAPSAPTLTAEEIVARHVEARGGLKKIRAIQSLRQEGHATTGAGRRAVVKRELKRPGRIRFEFTMQGVTAVFASDGKNGWKVSPFEASPEPQPLPEEVVQEALEQADIEGPLVGYREKGHRVDLVGREPLGSGEAYRLKLTLKSGAVRYEFIDVKSFALVRTESTRQVRGRPVRIEMTFGDHRKSGGVLFPRQVEVGAVGRPQRLKIDVESVEVNPPLNDSRFAMPASVRP